LNNKIIKLKKYNSKNSSLVNELIIGEQTNQTSQKNHKLYLNNKNTDFKNELGSIGEHFKKVNAMIPEFH
jgi:hypothetical protein